VVAEEAASHITTVVCGNTGSETEHLVGNTDRRIKPELDR
jgi:hypothetical protein